VRCVFASYEFKEDDCGDDGMYADDMIDHPESAERYRVYRPCEAEDCEGGCGELCGGAWVDAWYVFSVPLHEALESCDLLIVI
jgi:hypothetical protein